MVRLLEFLQTLVHMYEFVLIIVAVMSWVVASGRISRFDPRVRDVMQALDGLTEPILRRIRPWLPNTGPLDLSLMALFLLCIFLDQVVIGTLLDPRNGLV